jgi:hypothetical protein
MPRLDLNHVNLNSPCDVYIGRAANMPSTWCPKSSLSTLDDLSVQAVGKHSVVVVTQSEIGFALRSLDEAHRKSPLNTSSIVLVPLQSVTVRLN